MARRPENWCLLLLAPALLLTTDALSQDNSQGLAKKPSNPVASLISVPLQFNYDDAFGPDDGHKTVLNIQPVILISLSDDWNVISRTILPIVWQNDIAGPSGERSSPGDITQPDGWRALLGGKPGQRPR